MSTFRFIKQVTVGQTDEQVVILLGPPLARISDAAEMEKLARQYWPAVKENEPSEVWTYPSGWCIYMKDTDGRRHHAVRDPSLTRSPVSRIP